MAFAPAARASSRPAAAQVPLVHPVPSVPSFHIPAQQMQEQMQQMQQRMQQRMQQMQYMEQMQAAQMQAAQMQAAQAAQMQAAQMQAAQTQMHVRRGTGATGTAATLGAAPRAESQDVHLPLRGTGGSLTTTYHFEELEDPDEPDAAEVFGGVMGCVI